MDDRRKETRKKLMTFMPVYEAGSSRSLLGYLGDLTLQGALVLGEKHLELGSIHRLEIRLPDEMPLVYLSLPARVARMAPDEAPGSYKIGFEFTQMDENHAQVIETLLERYHFRHRR